MATLNSAFLRAVKLSVDLTNPEQEYPFALAAVRALAKELAFDPKLTILVCENGSGKSTLFEAIATAYGLNPEGGSRNMTFSTRESHSELHRYLTLVKGVALPHDAYFLRAESFYNLASKIDDLDEDRPVVRP